MSNITGTGENSVRLEIEATPRAGSSTQGSPDFNLWGPSDESSVREGSHANDPNVEAPEKELTLFALRLAILEQLASSLGTLAFIWATVVLLGGFAIALSRRDFWFVTIILVIEGARIFSRSGEIEWQHLSTWTSAVGTPGSVRALRRVATFFKVASPILADQGQVDQNHIQAQSRCSSSRTWNFHEVPLLSFWGRIFLLKNIGEFFIWLQVSFAIGSMTLSLLQLVSQNFGKPTDSEMNRDTALNLFYALACANDMLFLTEKLYWSWKIHGVKLLESVRKKCGFKEGNATTDLVRRFFYDVYSGCINESIFGGLKKDLVSYAQKLLESGELDKNLMGAQILNQFVHHEQFSFDTIRKVGTSGKIMDRLIEMLSWKNKSEVEIRMLAVQIVSKISDRRKGSIRIAKIPGSLEVISSLLHNVKNENESGYDYTTFNLQGLLILRNLTSDHENCEKIRKCPELISKIVKFTATSPNLLLEEHVVDISQITLVKRALEVLLLLARTKGDTGNALHQLMSRNVFLVGNIREILKNGKKHMKLQKISLEILTFLAMDKDATERIAGTGRVINLLLEIFFEPGVSKETSVSDEAGEALSMLTLKSQKSCNMILRECNVVAKMVEMLSEELQGPYASRILRNVCVYATPESSGCLNVVIGTAFPIVLRRTIEQQDKTLLEVSIGLVVAACLLMDHREFNEGLVKANIDLATLVKRLTGILIEYEYPDNAVPRLRRYVIELSIWMMKHLHEHRKLFKEFDMKNLLESVAKTTTDLENFHHFSGSVGLYQHTSTVAALVEEALELLHQGSSTNSN